ncbi:MAG: ImmA/IrrE family metallo-endopeptidase [Bacteroidales bacterium]|jgi:Zn-dependent peptidase ImmA (M78 family)|nr:ImmA/IrrE family metallo-endopeptidase [Bacteroidales bacterium]
MAVSTTTKGTNFENAVFELVEKLVKKGDFFVPNKCSIVYKKKKYYSDKRKSDIIFDITIETKIANAPKYSTLTIIECKNLNRPISIDDIEEFSSKINQVGEHNTKGIIITSNTFQKAAKNYAENTGIALIRILSNKSLDWISYRKDSRIKKPNKEEIEYKLTEASYNAQPFIGLVNDTEILNFADLLLEYGIIDGFTDSEEFIDIPFITNDRINEIVQRLENRNVYNGLKLDIDNTIQLLEDIYQMKFYIDVNDDEDYLGKISFNPLYIKISNKARVDKNRWRFTIAHEIGHLILHSKILKERINEKSDTEQTLFEYYQTNGNSKRLEMQANLFASYLLLPKHKLQYSAYQLFKQYRIHRNQLYLDWQKVNQQEVYEILRKLSDSHEVSVEAVKIRLIQLGLLVDKTDMRLSTILRQLKW